MIDTLALGVVLLAAGWLAFIAGICVLIPEKARAGLASMGSTWPIQIGEHAMRALVGAALVGRAVESKAPMLFFYGGWFLVVTSVLILALPKHWHNAYSVWWARRIPLWAYRVLALPTLIAAGALVYLAI